MTPEHIHVAVNHIAFLGAGFALVPLLIGLLTRNRPVVLTGLLLAALAGWTTPIVMATGEAAYKRYEEGPVAAYLDPNAEPFIDEHEHRAEAWSKALYAAAAISTLSLLLLLARPSWTRPLAALSALACAAALASGIFIAESGGKIRRPDFRSPQANAAATSPAPAQTHGGREETEHEDGRDRD